MKKATIYLLLIIASLFTACEDNDKLDNLTEQEVLKFFEDKTEHELQFWIITKNKNGTFSLERAVPVESTSY